MVGSFAGQPFLRRRQADFQQPGAQRTLSGDERGAAGGAGLLSVIVGEDRAFVGDAVDVGRAVAHHAAIVGADVPVADVIAHDDEDVRLLLLLRRRGCDHCGARATRSSANRMFLLLFIVDLLPKGLFDRVLTSAGAPPGAPAWCTGSSERASHSQCLALAFLTCSRMPLRL